jgi:hypothetical protein
VSHPQPAVLSAAEEPEVWQPHAAEEFQPVDKVGKIAIGLLGASTLTHLLSTWSDWNTYGVVHTYLGGGPNVDDADLNRADSIAKIIAYPNVLVSVAAAVLFVIWLWRARVNSEVLCQADHRRSHGWVLASWFTPGPNFFYPKQIVDDIWVASDPKTPVYADDLRRLRKPLLTKVWWYAWVGALVFDVVIRRVLMWMDATVGSLRGIALAGTASLMLTVVSAAAATFVIRKINAMQASRPGRRPDVRRRRHLRADGHQRADRGRTGARAAAGAAARAGPADGRRRRRRSPEVEPVRPGRVELAGSRSGEPELPPGRVLG